MNALTMNAHDATEKEGMVVREDAVTWTNSRHRNVNHLSSIVKMIDNSQSELLQAQIDLQDGQHQIRKLESILQSYDQNFTDKTQSSIHSHYATGQVNRNNDQESSKVHKPRFTSFIKDKSLPLDYRAAERNLVSPQGQSECEKASRKCLPVEFAIAKCN